MYRFLGKSPPTSLTIPLPKTIEPIKLSNNQKDTHQDQWLSTINSKNKNVKDEQNQPSNQETTK
jgi:hypothetical protein